MNLEDRIKRRNSALQEFIDENREVLQPREDEDFQGSPFITGGVLVLHIIDSGASDPATEAILSIRTPGCGHVEKVGLLQTALKSVLDN